VRTVASEKEFSDWLLELGDGRSGANISLPASCFSNTQNLVEHLYGDITFNTVTPQQVKDRAILDVKNEDSLELNNKVLDHISGEEGIYGSVDTVAIQEPNDNLT
jgi:hypothetical protein